MGLLGFLGKKKTPVAESLENSACESSDCNEHLWTYELVKEMTMTSPERVLALCEAVDYLTDHSIAGDIVECGVWRGGSMMAVAKTLMRQGDLDRRLWMYDTFEGMSSPTEQDVDFLGNQAKTLLSESSIEQADSIWCRAHLQEVKRNLSSTQYPEKLLNFVIGPVEETLLDKNNLPSKISLLRLDTDWYESTKVELEILFPRLVPGGVLIIDDYGHWQGCRQAVDEYLQRHNIQIFLNRIDYTGRIGIKQQRIQNKGLHNVA
ncbi:MAG: TylF/MycF/NovP-related O-methyltransferase [Planctomycetota bacterium]